MDEKEKALEIMFKEYQETWNVIHAHLTSAHRLLSIGFALIGSAILVGLKEGLYEVFLVIPFALIVLVFYWLNLHLHVVTLGGYRKYIEGRINSEINQKVLLWETIIAPKMHRNKTGILLLASYGMVFLLCLFSSVFIATTSYGLKGYAIIFSVWVAFTIGICVSAREYFRRFELIQRILEKETSVHEGNGQGVEPKSQGHKLEE